MVVADEQLKRIKDLADTAIKTNTTTTKTTTTWTTWTQAIKDSLKNVEQKDVSWLKSIWQSTKWFVSDMYELGSTLWNRYVSNKDKKKWINDYKQYNEYMWKMASTTSQEEYDRLYNEMVGKNIINEKRYNQYQEEEKDWEKYEFEQAKRADRDAFNQRFEEAMQPYMKNINNRYQIDCISSAVQKMEKQYELFHEKIMTAYEDTRDDRLLEQRDKERKEYEDNIIKFTTQWADTLVNQNKTYSTAYKDTIANDTYRNLANGITTIERQMTNKIYKYTIGKNLWDMQSYNPMKTMYNGLLALKNGISWVLSQASNAVEELKEAGWVYDVTEKLNNLYVFDEDASKWEHIAESARWLWRSLLDYAPQATPTVIELILFKKAWWEEQLMKKLDTLADSAKIGKIAQFERNWYRFSSRLMSSLIADNLVYDEAFQTFTGRPISNEEENINLTFNLALDWMQALLRWWAKWIKPALKEAQLKTDTISEAALQLIRNEDNEARAIEKYYLLRWRETTEWTRAFRKYNEWNLIKLSDLQEANPELYEKVIKAQEGSTKYYERLSTYKWNVNDMLLEAEQTFKRKDMKNLSTLELIDRVVDDVWKKSKFIREAWDNLLLWTKTTWEIIYRWLQRWDITEEQIRTLVKVNWWIDWMDDLILWLAKSDNDLINKGMYTVSKSWWELSNQSISQIYNNILADLIKTNPNLVQAWELAGTFMKGKDWLFRNIFDYDAKGFNLDEFVEHIKSKEEWVFGSDRIALMDNINSKLAAMEKQMVDNPNAELEQDMTDIFKNVNGFSISTLGNRTKAEQAFIEDVIKKAGFKIVKDEQWNLLKVMWDINTLQKIKTNIIWLSNKWISEFWADDVNALKFLYIWEFTDSFAKYTQNVWNPASITKKKAKQIETQKWLVDKWLEQPHYNKNKFAKDYKCWFEKLFDIKEVKWEDWKIIKQYALKLQFNNETMQKNFKELLDNNAKFKDIERLASTNIIQDITQKAVNLWQSDEQLLKDIEDALIEWHYVEWYTKEIDPIVNALFNQVKWLSSMGIKEKNAISSLSHWFWQLVVDKDTLQILSRIDSDYLYKGIISRLIMQNDEWFMIFENSIKRTLEWLPINIKRNNKGISKILDKVEKMGNDRRTVDAVNSWLDKIKDIDAKIKKIEGQIKFNNKSKVWSITNAPLRKDLKKLNEEKAKIEQAIKPYTDWNWIIDIKVPKVTITDRAIFLGKMQSWLELVNEKQFIANQDWLLKKLRNKGKIKKDWITIGSDRILITDIKQASDGDLELLWKLVAYKSMSELWTKIPWIADKIWEEVYHSLLRLKNTWYDRHISFWLWQTVDETIEWINLSTLWESKVIQMLLWDDDTYTIAWLMWSRSVDKWISDLAFKWKYIYLWWKLRPIDYLKTFEWLEQFSTKTDDLFWFIEDVVKNIKTSKIIDKDDIIADLAANYVKIHSNTVWMKTYNELVEDSKFIADISNKIDELKKIRKDLKWVNNLYWAKLGKKRTSDIEKINDKLSEIITMYERMRELSVWWVKSLEDLEWQLTANLWENLYAKILGIQNDLPAYPSWIWTDMIWKGGFLQQTLFPEVWIYDWQLVTSNLLVNDLWSKWTNKVFSETDLTNMDLKLGWKKLVIFDLEATGNKLKNNPEITELSYTIIEEWEKPVKVTKYFRINKETTYFDNWLTKAKLEELANWTFKEALDNKELDEFINLTKDDDVYFIAHNASWFDRPLLEQNWIHVLSDNVVDTLTISKLLRPLNWWWKQWELVSADNIQLAMQKFVKEHWDDIERHNAEYDVEELQYLFYYLYDNLLKNWKVKEWATADDVLWLMNDLTKKMDINFYEWDEKLMERTVWQKYIHKSWKEEVLWQFESWASKYAETSNDEALEFLEKFPWWKDVALNDVLLILWSNLKQDWAIQLYNWLKKILPANAVISKDKLFIWRNVRNEYMLYRQAGWQLSFDWFVLNRNVAAILSNFGMYNETTLRALNKYTEWDIMKDLLNKIVVTNEKWVINWTRDTTLLSTTLKNLYEKHMINIDGYNNINDLIDDIAVFASEQYWTELEELNKLLYRSEVLWWEVEQQQLTYKLRELINNLFYKRWKQDVSNLEEWVKIEDALEWKFSNNWNNIVPVEDTTWQWSKQSVHPTMLETLENVKTEFHPSDLLDDILDSLEETWAIRPGTKWQLRESLDILDFASEYQDMVDAFRMSKFNIDDLINSPMFINMIDRIKNKAEIEWIVSDAYKKTPSKWIYSRLYKKNRDSLSRMEEYIKSTDEWISINNIWENRNTIDDIVDVERNGYSSEAELWDDVEDLYLDAFERWYEKEWANWQVNRNNYEWDAFEWTSKIDQLKESRSWLWEILEDFVTWEEMRQELIWDRNLEFSTKFIIEEDWASMEWLNWLKYNAQINIASAVNAGNKADVVKYAEDKIASLEKDKKKWEENTGSFFYDVKKYISWEDKELTAADYININWVVDLIWKDIKWWVVNNVKFDTIYWKNSKINNLTNSKTAETKFKNGGFTTTENKWKKTRNRPTQTTFDINSDEFNMFKAIDELIWVFDNNGKIKIDIDQGKNHHITSIYLNKDNFRTSWLWQDLLEKMWFSRRMWDFGNEFVFKEIQSKLYIDAITEKEKWFRIREVYLWMLNWKDRQLPSFEDWSEEQFKDCLSLSNVHWKYIWQFSKEDKKRLADIGKEKIYKIKWNELSESDKIAIARLEWTSEDISYLLDNHYINKKDLDDVVSKMKYEDASGKEVYYEDMDDYIMKNYFIDEWDRKKLWWDILYDKKFKTEVYSRFNSNLVSTYRKLKQFNKDINPDDFSAYDDLLERLQNYSITIEEWWKQKKYVLTWYRQDYLETREELEATPEMLENDALFWDMRQNVYEEYDIIPWRRWITDADTRNEEMHNIEWSDSYMTLQYVQDPDEIVVRMQNADNQDEIIYWVLRIDNYTKPRTYEFFPFKWEARTLDPYPPHGSAYVEKEMKWHWTKYQWIEHRPDWPFVGEVKEMALLQRPDWTVKIVPNTWTFKWGKGAKDRAEMTARKKFLEKWYNSEVDRYRRKAWLIGWPTEWPLTVRYKNLEGHVEIRELSDQWFMVRNLKMEEDLLKKEYEEELQKYVKKIKKEKKNLNKKPSKKIKDDVELWRVKVEYIDKNWKDVELKQPFTNADWDTVIQHVNEDWDIMEATYHVDNKLWIVVKTKDEVIEWGKWAVWKTLYRDSEWNIAWNSNPFKLEDTITDSEDWTWIKQYLDKNWNLIEKVWEKDENWKIVETTSMVSRGNWEIELNSLWWKQKYDWENNSFAPIPVQEKAAIDWEKIAKDWDEILETNPFDFVSKKFIENRYLNWTNNDIIKQSDDLQQIIWMRSNFIRRQWEQLRDAVTKFEETIENLSRDEKEQIYGKIKSAANRYIWQWLNKTRKVSVEWLTKEQQDALDWIMEVFNQGEWRWVYQLAAIQTKEGFQSMLKNIAHNHMWASLEYFGLWSKNAVKDKLTKILKQFEWNEKELKRIVEDVVWDPLWAGKLYNFLTWIRSARRFIKYWPLFPLTWVLMFINSAVMGNIRYIWERRGFLDIMKTGAFDRLITKAWDTVQIWKETKKWLWLADSMNRANEIMFNSNSDLGWSRFDKCLDWALWKLPISWKTREIVETAVKWWTHSLYDLFSQWSIKSMALAKALAKNGVTARNIDNFADLLEAGKIWKEQLNKILADTEMIYSRFYTNSATSLLSRHKFSRLYMFNALQWYVINRSDEIFSSVKDAVNWISRRRQLAKQKIWIEWLEHLEWWLWFKRSDFVDYLQNDNQELQSFLINVILSAKFGFYFDKMANGWDLNSDTYSRYLIDTSDYLSSVWATFFWNILSAPFEWMIDYADYANSNYDDFNIWDWLTVAWTKLISQVFSQFFREGKFINALSSWAVALWQTWDLDFSYDVLIDEFRKIASWLWRFQLVEWTNTYWLDNMWEQWDFIWQILFNNQYTSTAWRFTDKLQSLQTVDKILNGEDWEYTKQTLIPYLPLVWPLLSNAINGTWYSFSATKYKELLHIMDKDNVVNWLNDYDIENDHWLFANSDIFWDEQIKRLYQELTAFDYPEKQYIWNDLFDTGYEWTLEPIKEDIFTEELLRDLDWDKETLDEWIMSWGTNEQKWLLKVMAAADASRPGSSKIVLSYLANRYNYNRMKELTGDKYWKYKDLPVEIQQQLNRETVELYYPYMFIADKTSWYKAITEYIWQHYPLFEELYKDDDLTWYTSTLWYMDMIMYQQAKEWNVNAKFIKNSWAMLSKYFKNEPARINAITYTMNSIDNAGFSKWQATAAKMWTLAANMDIYDKYQKNAMALSMFWDDIENYNYFVWWVLQDINQIWYDTAEADLAWTYYWKGWYSYKKNKYKPYNYSGSWLGNNNIPEAEKFVPAATKYLNWWEPEPGKNYITKNPRTYQPWQTLDYYRKVYEAHVKALSDKLVKPRDEWKKGKGNGYQTYDWQYKYWEWFRNRGYVNPAKLVFPRHKQPAYSTKVLANMPGASG